MKRSEESNVTTWADAFGVWHARVTYDRNPLAAAQVAVWREIEARQGAPAPVPDMAEVEPGHFVEVPAVRETPRLDALLREVTPWGGE